MTGIGARLVELEQENLALKARIVALEEALRSGNLPGWVFDVPPAPPLSADQKRQETDEAPPP